MPGNKITRREFVRDTAVAAAVAAGAAAVNAGEAKAPEVDKSKIVNYNKNMEYRRCGRTGLMVSAVALGGHCKQVAKVLPPGINTKGIWGVHIDEPSFQKNRHDVVSRMIEVGMNWIDACTVEEVKAHNRALKGRRDKMYLACSWFEREMRSMRNPTAGKLLQVLDWGLKDAELDYADLWRPTLHEQSGPRDAELKGQPRKRGHSDGDIEEMMKALETAKKQGKVRFTGFSSHDRPHIQWMIKTYPKIVDIVVTPSLPKTKKAHTDSLFDTLKEYDVGYFGIKPYASGSLFKGRGSPVGPAAEEDDKTARIVIRELLENPVLTAPIPGLITTHQVDVVALAVKERKEGKALTQAERQLLDDAMQDAWANLPPGYAWLREWECV
ncbi:MAG: aldo/keto reductase [Planctomycetes bacterium]|nr:aldo/keto reductase [Planctomycetota bacterium]